MTAGGTDHRPLAKELYGAEILAHAREPRGGELPEGAAVLQRDNPLCGDRVRLHGEVGERALAGLACETRGCQLCLASASMMCEEIEGRALQECVALCSRVLALGAQDGPGVALPGDMHALEKVRDFPERLRCVTLPWEALMELLSASAERM